jgi:hypothetical protein
MERPREIGGDRRAAHRAHGEQTRCRGRDPPWLARPALERLLDLLGLRVDPARHPPRVASAVGRLEHRRHIGLRFATRKLGSSTSSRWRSSSFTAPADDSSSARAAISRASSSRTLRSAAFTRGRS